MKLMGKHRQAAKIRKKYDQAQTPYQRLLNSSHINQKNKEQLKKQYEKLDPVKLLKEIESLQNHLWSYAWKHKLNTEKISLLPTKETALRQYRRTPKPKKPRTWRTRKDAFETVWPGLRLRLDVNPHYTAKELMIELVKKYPTQFHMKQLRTLQRRVALWRMGTLGYAIRYSSKGSRPFNPLFRSYP